MTQEHFPQVTAVQLGILLNERREGRKIEMFVSMSDL